MQHTLVTEIRELVFPEDRTRYDELVYSRDPYLSERDRHRVSASYVTANLIVVVDFTNFDRSFTLCRIIVVMAFVRIEAVNHNSPELNTGTTR